jgi:hypothetical protein
LRRLNRSRPAGEAATVQRAAAITLATVSVWTVGGLWLDSRVGESGQLALGLLTACVLAALLVLQSPAVRVLALGVVVIATLGEVVGSLIWGLYGYRLDNLPAFVPPGHGLVYLAGFALATLVGSRATALLACASAAAAAWGIAGIWFLPATDVAGAIGCAFLILVFARTRRPVYAGVFVVVALLELYGTALGTWTWESTVPGLLLAQGNPPSGVASGYVVFDVVALWLTARASEALLRLRPRDLRRATAVHQRQTETPASSSERSAALSQLASIFFAIASSSRRFVRATSAVFSSPARSATRSRSW